MTTCHSQASGTVFPFAVNTSSLQVATNERPKKKTEAITQKREAETQAQISIDKALSNARILETKYERRHRYTKTPVGGDTRCAE